MKFYSIKTNGYSVVVAHDNDVFWEFSQTDENFDEFEQVFNDLSAAEDYSSWRRYRDFDDFNDSEMWDAFQNSDDFTEFLVDFYGGNIEIVAEYDDAEIAIGDTYEDPEGV